MLIVLWLVVTGLCLGSFVNALVWRLHEQEESEQSEAERKKAKSANKKMSILTGRSMCPHCQHQLAAKDLVPVVSWLWLRGKCRYCHHKIDDTPAAELLVPALFVFSYIYWPMSFSGWGLVEFCFWLVFLVGFVALALYDLRWFILPDRIVYPLMVLAAVCVGMHVIFYDGGWQAVVAAGWGVVIASGIFYVLFQLSQGKWIGGGDVKLGVVLGLLLGGPLNSLLLLFFASTFGSLVSVPLLLSGRAKRDTLIPFGPFLLLAAFVIMLFGGSITAWINGLMIR